MDIVLALAMEELDEDDLLVFLQCFGNKDKEDPKTFDLHSLSEEEVLKNFRFTVPDILNLAECLKVPEFLVTYSGTKAPGVEGLCILLRRLAYPNRLCDLMPLFGRSEPEISMLFNAVLDHIQSNFAVLLTDLNQPWITDSLQEFARAIHAKGAPLDHCWGFIDGTVWPMCRPGINQRLVYNGHKRVHALKYQSIMAPNGLVANLAGPFEGRRHDSFLLTESSVDQQLPTIGEGAFCIYGDPAYPLLINLMKPFQGMQLTPEQEQGNKDMSSVRQCVEWGFGKIIQQFGFLDFKKNQKLYLQPVGKYYLVGALLTNCHTCLYGSQTSSYFDVQPTTMQEYLSFADV